jgi:predicted DNA-binding transcriptional regulator YafY
MRTHKQFKRILSISHSLFVARFGLSIQELANANKVHKRTLHRDLLVLKSMQLAHTRDTKEGTRWFFSRHQIDHANFIVAYSQQVKGESVEPDQGQTCIGSNSTAD